MGQRDQASKRQKVKQNSKGKRKRRGRRKNYPWQKILVIFEVEHEPQAVISQLNNAEERLPPTWKLQQKPGTIGKSILFAVIGPVTLTDGRAVAREIEFSRIRVAKQSE